LAQIVGIRAFKASGATVATARRTGEATSELLDVVNLVTQAVWADLRRSNQTIELSQWLMLRRIGRSPCTMSELARHRGVGLPTISKSVEMLVGRGWVERWIDKVDRRQTLVRLSARGRRVLRDCRKRAEALIDHQLATLTAHERELIAANLEKLRGALTIED
jgi:DNA-binding MarR family transcriptional regulator